MVKGGFFNNNSALGFLFVDVLKYISSELVP